VHLIGFITKKFVTMHGHTNVKFMRDVYLACICNLGTQNSPRVRTFFYRHQSDE